MFKKKAVSQKKIEDYIVEGILEKKGQEIIHIDISHDENPVCENFIISHGDSNTQVRAIANAVQDKVKENLGRKVWHSEGYKNAKWILLDYNTVVVHIFQKDTRCFYKLEELWEDASVTKIRSEP